jgi:multidrug efflux pump subunit AcrA (membrane-fusion protein)
VIDKDRKAAHRPLKAKPINDEIVIVTEGVEAGEQVVVSGQYRVQDGTVVETSKNASAKKAGS